MYGGAAWWMSAGRAIRFGHVHIHDNTSGYRRLTNSALRVIGCARNPPGIRSSNDRQMGIRVDVIYHHATVIILFNGIHRAQERSAQDFEGGTATSL